MEMKGIIEHSILWEDGEIYRGRGRYREREREILEIYTENGSRLSSLPELTARQSVRLKFIRSNRVKGGVSSESESSNTAVNRQQRHIMREDRTEIGKGYFTDNLTWLSVKEKKKAIMKDRWR